MIRQARLVLEMIKFSHTVFALPFAVIGAVLAAGGMPSLRVCVWITAAMIGARSAGMTFNRILDRDIDSRNPRTLGRHLPKGSLSVGFAAGFFIVMTAIFFLSAYELNRMTFALSPVAFALFVGYSFLKRFTFLSHFVLGATLGLAPLGAWIAVTGGFHPLPVWLGVCVMLWVSGFDILYACQDYEADVREGLHSVPVKLGIARSLRLSAALHGVMIAALGYVGYAYLPGAYFIGATILIALLLIYEHLLVTKDDLSRINDAFFTVNGVISTVLMAAVLLEVFLSQRSSF